MRKFLIVGAAVAAMGALGLFAMSAPADAATRNAAGIVNAQAVQMDLSARRYYRGHYYRGYYRPYHRRYYGPGYPYSYYYGPRYYYPYGNPYYYGRPGVYFRFGW
jgi:hypothetical protein